jgi:acyl transferase domain-containing protein
VAASLAHQEVSKAGCAALAGGINMTLLGSTTAMFQKAGMLAPDGRCKALDAAADGYVRAEGCAVLLLAAAGAAPQPLALLAGSAVNQDGRASSLTAPNGPSQQQVVLAALASGALDAGDVLGLQLHGTGERAAAAAAAAPSAGRCACCAASAPALLWLRSSRPRSLAGRRTCSSGPSTPRAP